MLLPLPCKHAFLPHEPLGLPNISAGGLHRQSHPGSPAPGRARSARKGCMFLAMKHPRLGIEIDVIFLTRLKIPLKSEKFQWGFKFASNRFVQDKVIDISPLRQTMVFNSGQNGKSVAPETDRDLPMRNSIGSLFSFYFRWPVEFISTKLFTPYTESIDPMLG